MTSFNRIFLLFTTIGSLLLNSSFSIDLEQSRNTDQVIIAEHTIDELTQSIQAKVDQQKQLIQNRKDQIHSLNNKLLITSSKKERNIIQKQYDANIESKKQLEDKNNCYLFLLTMIKQCSFLPNIQRKSAIEQIDKFILLIDKNEITYQQILKKNEKSIFANSAKNYSYKNDCVLEKSIDGKVIANQFVPFFSFTPADLTKHYPQEDFLQTYVRLLQSGNKNFLELRFDFNTLKASQFYGIIEESSPMKLIFLDQDFIYLQNSKTASPELQAKSGKTIYKMQCQLSRADFKKLKQKDLEKLIILWPSGSETYELFDFHVIQNLSECLKQKI